jgi:hypothetical protein
MRQPPGFVDQSCPQHLCRLEKVLYVLKQALHACHARLGSVLRTNGFVLSTTDMSLFRSQCPQLTMYLLVYVDDMILISSSEFATDHLVTALGADFAVKNLSKLHYFLGLKVTHFDARLTHSPEIFQGVVTPSWYAQVQSGCCPYVCYWQTYCSS